MAKSVVVRPFLGLKEAAEVTGLSVYYLRNGCRAGTIPHILAGNEYRVNIAALLDQMGVPYERLRIGGE
jgi:hypothetical protein